VRFYSMTLHKLFTALLLLLTLPAAAAPHYQVTDVGPIQQEDTFAVNSHRQIVGSISYATIGEGIKPAWLWAHGRRTFIKPQEGFECVTGCMINDKGEVAGTWATTTDGATLVYQKRAFLWRQGHSRDVFKGVDDQTQTEGLSSLGEVVGTEYSADHPEPDNPQLEVSHVLRHPVTGRTIDLGPGMARAANSRGQVVGDDGLDVVLWEGGRERRLGVDGQAIAINNQSQILINGGRGGQGRPFLWQNGKARSLPIPADTNAIGFALNEAGDVVGARSTSAQVFRALLWRGGHVYDLNTLLPPRSGWILETATGTNTAGQIVGSGKYHGKPHAFLLTPSKEP